MRIWNFLIIYSCLSDADKKGLEDENDTAVDEEHTVFLKDVLPKEEYKVVEEEQKKTKMEEKLKVPTHKFFKKRNFNQTFDGEAFGER